MMSGALITPPAGTHLSKPGQESTSATNPGKTNLTAKHSPELAIVQLNGPLTPPTSSATKLTTKKRRRSVNHNNDDVASSPTDGNQSSRTPFPSPTKSRKKRQRHPIYSKSDTAAADVTLPSSPLRSKAKTPRCAKAGKDSNPPVTSTASPTEAKAKKKRASLRKDLKGDTTQNAASNLNSSDAPRSEYGDWMPPEIDSDDDLVCLKDATSSSNSSSFSRRSDGDAERPSVFQGSTSSGVTTNKNLDLAITSSALPARFYSMPPPGGLGVHVSQALTTAVHPVPIPRVAQEETEKIIEKKLQSTLGPEVTRLVHEVLSSHTREPPAPRATCRAPAALAEDKTALFRKTYPLEERLSDERLIAIAREMPSTRNKKAPYAFTEKGRFRHEYRRLFVQAGFSYKEAQRLFY